MDEAEAQRLYGAAARRALAAFGMEGAKIRFIHLSENVAFEATEAPGARFVLRLHRPWYHDLDELKSERVFTRALAAAGISAPQGRRTRKGEDFVAIDIPETGETRQAGVTGWIEGELMSDVIAREGGEAEAAARIRELGRLMARLHEFSFGWAPPAGFRRHRLDEDGLMGAQPFWGQFWRHPALSAAQAGALIAAREKMHAAMAKLPKTAQTFGLIHADLHAHNVLVGPAGTAVIDFDDCGFGWRLHDLAVALVSYLGRLSFEALRAALIAGYREVRPLPGDELEHLPMFLAARGMAQIGWLMQRPEHDGGPDFARWTRHVCARAARFANGEEDLLCA